MNILLIGKPGAGKGTITQELLGLNFVQLSTGDLIRQEKAKGSELGKKLKLLPVGTFASDDMIFELVENFLNEHNDKNIIFDGFPRNLKQAEEFMKRNIALKGVFEIDVDDKILEKRIVNRRIHEKSGRVYNLLTKPPKVDGIDDITGEPLVHRHDDHADILQKRLNDFYELTNPIINYLKNHGVEIVKINGEAPLEDQLQIIKSKIRPTVKP